MLISNRMHRKNTSHIPEGLPVIFLMEREDQWTWGMILGPGKLSSRRDLSHNLYKYCRTVWDQEIFKFQEMDGEIRRMIRMEIAEEKSIAAKARHLEIEEVRRGEF